eukprot:TRINITY_DN1573_c0_g1_i12.p1 TRINITY_DN1573_c0_g1~~TRINITY_DN1573_c0_g1_i12.p1  ORF type:complete len:204 (+),score=27.58 TRINITY_DN1573_c0_g1_i12:66-677(+)
MCIRDRRRVHGDSDILYNRGRLVSLSLALNRLELRCKQYLREYEKGEDWNKFRAGFLHLNHHFRPSDVVELQVCDLADKEIAYFMPNKKKILVCYNKINDKSHFSQVVTYQMTLFYDSLRAKVNWADCKQLSCMHIRALHLSRICDKHDRDCFKKSLSNSLYNTDVCRAKDAVFDKVFSPCLVDISPINMMRYVDKKRNFLFQ